MRTTLDIDDALLAKAKALAAREHTTLTRIVEEGLVLRLGTRAVGRRVAEVPRLPVYRGRGGLVAGVDPLSNSSLFAAADEEER